MAVTDTRVRRHGLVFHSGHDFRSTNANMFAEDLAQAGPALRDVLETRSSSEAGVERLERLLRGQRNETTIEIVATFLEELVRILAWRGEAWFELVEVETREEEVTILLPLPIHATYLDLPSRVAQIVPRAHRDQTGGKSFALIPTNRAWGVKLPRRLGTSRSHRRLLRTLEFHEQIWPDLRQQSSFDFTAYNRRLNVGLATATRTWGWEGRGLWRDSTLEYYTVVRWLRFFESKRFLVEHVIGEFNSLLIRLGLGVEFGLRGRDADGLRKALAELATGNLSMMEATDLALGKPR